MTQILLVKKASGLNYSIEAGVHDGIRNFDHHPGIAGAEGQPCPARNASIPKIIGVANHIVEISHIDADTLLGIWRMAGFNDPTSDWLGWLDLKMLEQIDLNGTSGVPPCDTLFFVIGVSEIAKSLGFPRVADEPQDVTPIVREMIGRKSFADFVAAGQTAHARSEAAYRTCRQGISPNGKVGFWAIGKDDPLDPSRPVPRRRWCSRSVSLTLSEREYILRPDFPVRFRRKGSRRDRFCRSFQGMRFASGHYL